MAAPTPRQRQVAAQRVVRDHLRQLDLMQFVPAVTPEYDAPMHLRPMVDMVEEALTEAGVRAVTSVPPQHAKSETLFHLLCKMLLDDPTQRHVYGTYSIEFAGEQSIKALRVAQRCYLPLQRTTMHEWVTPQGGGIAWVGRGGRLTGRPVDGIAIVDDPLKNWTEARSPTIRRRALDFVREVLQRLHPGASLILNATRWHPDDPSGHFIKQGWRHVNLPAIIDGKPLWPEHRPMSFLMEQKADVGPHDWGALFMGNPQPEGERVFHGVRRYDALPPEHVPYMQAWGFDGAYTEKASADYSVAFQGRFYQHDADGRRTDDWRLYITDCVRTRAEPDGVTQALLDAGVKRVRWRRSGTEKGMVALLEREGISVDVSPAVGDKLANARPLQNDWRKGRILFPSDALWMPEVEAEILAFTGRGTEEHDDCVDALAALHEALLLYRGPDVDELRRASGLA